MPSVTLLHREPDGQVRSQVLSVDATCSLMQAAVNANVKQIVADCGGTLSCATCHVYVAPEWIHRLPAATTEELDMLAFTAAQQRSNSRLSCQITLNAETDGLVVELPDSQY